MPITVLGEVQGVTEERTGERRGYPVRLSEVGSALSALWLGQPLTRRTLGALALCYAGIALAVAHDLRLAGTARDLALGGVLVFGSALAYALYLLGSGKIVGRLGAGCRVSEENEFTSDLESEFQR
jgi:hypothetical protein